MKTKLIILTLSSLLLLACGKSGFTEKDRKDVELSVLDHYRVRSQGGFNPSWSNSGFVISKDKQVITGFVMFEDGSYVDCSANYTGKQYIWRCQ